MSFKLTSFAVLVAWVLSFDVYSWKTNEFHFNGTVDSSYQAVFDVFKENFEIGLVSEGAAFSVYVDGKLVVDVWGGYADYSTNREWKADTMGLWFSTTKAIAALCIAVLIDRDLLNYQHLVIKYWPEFGKNGKTNITLEMILNHEAGLAVLDEDFTMQEAEDLVKLSQILERQKPFHTPGAKRFYHVLTFGWLLDQIVRRVDPQNRSIGAWFHDEIAKPYGIDFYIGLPLEHDSRVATLCKPSFLDMFGLFTDPVYRRIALDIVNPFSDSFIKKVFTIPSWISANSANIIDTFNSREFRALELSAANGIGTAKALAKAFSLLISGRVISRQLLNALSKPVRINVYDELFTVRVTTGWGFMFGKNPMGQYVFMHPGLGGQNLKVDPHNNVAMAYLTNGMKLDLGEKSVVFQRLEIAVYECLKNIRNNQNLTAEPTAWIPE